MEQENPLVCICIPVYNAERTIRETISSIINQTYKNIEIHVVDNASIDNTLAIVSEFNDSRITIHCNGVNIGGEGNFNRCIELATGKYTAIFHADDVYEPNIIEKQVSCFQTDINIGAVFTAAKTIDSAGAVTGSIGASKLSSNTAVFDFNLLFKSILKFGNFIVCPSAMVRTDIYKDQILWWRGDLFRSSADLDVWLRIAEYHSIVFLEEELMRYRVDSNQFSNQVRLRCERADFFLVTDYYLKNSKIQKFLINSDRLNYEMLVINDKVWRSINQYLNGNIEEATLLLRGLMSLKLFPAIFCSRRDLMTVAASIFLRLAITFKMYKASVVVLNYFRAKYNK